MNTRRHILAGLGASPLTELGQALVDLRAEIGRTLQPIMVALTEQLGSALAHFSTALLPLSEAIAAIEIPPMFLEMDTTPLLQLTPKQMRELDDHRRRGRR